MDNLNLRKYISLTLFILLIFVGQQFTPDTKVHLLLHFGIFRIIPEGIFIYIFNVKESNHLSKFRLLLGLSTALIFTYLLLPFSSALFIEQHFIDLLLMHVIIVIKNPFSKSEWTYTVLILAYFLADILFIFMRK